MIIPPVVNGEYDQPTVYFALSDHPVDKGYLQLEVDGRIHMMCAPNPIPNAADALALAAALVSMARYMQSNAYEPVRRSTSK